MVEAPPPVGPIGLVELPLQAVSTKRPPAISAVVAVVAMPNHPEGTVILIMSIMSLHSGSRLGSYEVTALIGEGGMSEVYRAHDTKLGRDVALKVRRSRPSPSGQSINAAAEKVQVQNFGSSRL